MIGFTFFFSSQISEPGLYFTIKTHLNSDTKFSLEMLSRYLDLMKFTVEKLDLQTQVFPIIVEFF